MEQARSGCRHKDDNRHGSLRLSGRFAVFPVLVTVIVTAQG